MAAEILEGDLVCQRHGDGRVEIVSAPPTTRISLEFLTAADPAVVVVRGHRLTLATQVEYEVTGWDAMSHALIAKRVS